MLDAIRKGQRWLTGLFVAAVGIVFVFFVGLGGPLRGGPSGDAVVELGEIRLDRNEFLRIRARQEEAYRQQLGDQFEPRAVREILDTMALNSLVQSAILAHEAEELGLRVGKAEIQRLLRDSPGFRDESGKFDNESFSRYVEYEYGNQRNYLRYMRRVLLGQKLADLLYSQAQVSDAELRASVLYDLQRVRLAYVALETEALPAGVEVTEEQIDDYLSSHATEIDQLYQQRRETFDRPPQVKVRHILFAVGREADESEVESTRQRAENALARLQAGEEFEALAQELSEDPKSKEKGGDLGWVTRGELAGGLEEVAFALERGATAELARSDAGFHVVRVDERQEASSRTVEDVRRELAREGAEAVASRRWAEELSQKLATAIRSGKTLEEAARDEGRAVERTTLLPRRPDGFVPGIGSASELLAMAFAMDEGQSSPKIFLVGSQLVLIQLLERKEPDPEAVESAMPVHRNRLQMGKRNTLLETWLQLRHQELLDSGRLLIDDSTIRRS